MARTRNSSLWLVLWGGLLFLSLRPVAPVERAVAVLLAPLRLVAELGRPLDLVHALEAAAAERELAAAAAREAAEGAETLARLAARALPRDPRLAEARRFVPAEVLERPSSDECWAAVGQSLGMARGAPVVCGDVYVGRVLEVRPGPETLVRVQLVTAASFRVGAVIRAEDAVLRGAETVAGTAPGAELQRSAEPVYLTVGGVRVARRGEPRMVRLAAHQPSSSEVAGGLVRVHELFADADDSGGLAEGFRLGELRRAGERDLSWVEPELDYLDGLFQLAIVVPESAVDPLAARTAHALADGRWLATRALTSGDPSPWRSALKIPLGSRHGLQPGAAVTGVGARLVGRVIHAGLVTSDVALLADPGLTLAAVARIETAPPGAREGDAESAVEPRILGRLTSLGRGRDGRIRLRWSVRVPLELGADSAGKVRARLFTGSGDPGVPGGLFLGTAELPAVVRAGEQHELALEPGLDPAAVRRLFVRRDDPGARP